MTQTHGADLVLERVAKDFGARRVLSDISVTVPSGRITCLLGESGCGKSTLLRLIAGIEELTLGRILLGDQEISGPEIFVEPEARRIGFMFQDYALFPHLSVEANIAFGLKALPRGSRALRVEEICAKIGITHLLGRYPHALSGGEQQRVALARALAPEPRILLMDEPFSNLDQGLRAQVRGETVDLLRRLGATVIMVTHDPQEAMATADQIILMRAGRVEQAGAPIAIYDRPASAYAAEFMGSCNRLSGRVRAGMVETPLGRFTAPEGLTEGAPALVCIRPRALHLVGTGEGIAACIRRKTFLGDVEEIEVAIDSLSVPLRVVCHDRRTEAPGETVHLRIDRTQVHVFAAGA